MTLPSLRIRQAFSKAAIQYEKHAGLQKEIGLKLLRIYSLGDENIETRSSPGNEKMCPQRILDVGMGTGWLTEKISSCFPGSWVAGLDFAAGMIDCAKARGANFRIVQADARNLPFQVGAFDVVVSNLVYQWIDDLPQALSQILKALNEGGVFYFSCFTQGTLKELFLTLEQSFKYSRRDFPFIKRLAGKEKVRESLTLAGFERIEMTSEDFRVWFPDMLSLVKWIRAIGANGLKGEGFMGRDLLLKANDFYQRTFSNNGHVYASFEVVWGKARKH